MNHDEQALVFGAGARLVGIYTPARAPAQGQAVVLANSGIVHRVGAGRVTVTLARRLAQAGIASLRFDMSGLGDSVDYGSEGGGWETSAPREISEAVGLLRLLSGVHDIVLYGNCGGAAKCFWAACADPRVTGLAFTNPPPHPAEFEGDRMVATAAGEETTVQLVRLFDRGLSALFIYADGDEGLSYFERRLQSRLAPVIEAGRLQVRRVPHSNHTFALQPAQEHMMALILDWLIHRIEGEGH